MANDDHGFQGDGSAGDAERKYDRDLGVTEAFIAVRDQCPMGAVRQVAMQALDAMKELGPDAVRDQAYFVLTAIQGWRGERSRQVHRSLQAFLDATKPGG